MYNLTRISLLIEAVTGHLSFPLELVSPFLCQILDIKGRGLFVGVLIAIKSMGLN